MVAVAKMAVVVTVAPAMVDRGIVPPGGLTQIRWPGIRFVQ